MGAIVQRDWRIFASYRVQAVSRVTSLFFSLVLFHFIAQLVQVKSFSRPGDYFAFVVVGLVIMQVFQAGLGLPGAVRGELLLGSFERMVASPLGGFGAILALPIFPILISIVAGVISFGFAAAVFGLEMQLETVLLAVPMAALGSLSFASVGIALAALVIVVKQSAVGTGWVLAISMLVAGVYFPVELLPGWIQWASEVQPLTPFLDLMRYLLVGTPPEGSPWLELGRVVFFTVTLLPISCAALAASIRHAQRTGTITEY